MDAGHDPEPAAAEPAAPHKLTDCQKEEFAFVRAEFGALRGEIDHRIDLQHAAIQRALSLFGITATIAVAFFATLVRTRDANSPGQHLLDDAELLLLGKAAFVLMCVFCAITLLLICNWVYQLYLIFRIHEYTAWLGQRVDSLTGSSAQVVFRYSRHRLGQPWAVYYDRARFRYLQVIVLYSFTALSWVALLVLVFGLWSGASILQRVAGVSAITIIALAVAVLLWIHVSLHHLQPDHVTPLP